LVQLSQLQWVGILAAAVVLLAVIFLYKRAEKAWDKAAGAVL